MTHDKKLEDAAQERRNLYKGIRDALPIADIVVDEFKAGAAWERKRSEELLKTLRLIKCELPDKSQLKDIVTATLFLYEYEGVE